MNMRNLAMIGFFCSFAGTALSLMVCNRIIGYMGILGMLLNFLAIDGLYKNKIKMMEVINNGV